MIAPWKAAVMYEYSLAVISSSASRVGAATASELRVR